MPGLVDRSWSRTVHSLLICARLKLIACLQTAAGLDALDGTGINTGGLFKMEQSDDCVYDLLPNCADDGTLDSLPAPSETNSGGGFGGTNANGVAAGGVLGPNPFLGPNIFSIILYKLFKNLQDFFTMPFQSIGNGPLFQPIGNGP